MQLKKNPREPQFPAHDERDEERAPAEHTVEPFTPPHIESRPTWRREPPASFEPPIETRPAAAVPAAPLPSAAIPAPPLPPLPAFAPAPGSPAPAAAPSRGESVIDAHSSFEGRYETEQDLRVHGTIGGDVVCRGQLFIERDATARANIEARDAVVRGRLEGEINCSGRLVLEPTAIVSGVVRAALLVVQEGASLAGSVETGGGLRANTATAASDSVASGDSAGARDLPSFALVSSDASAERRPAR